MSPEHERALAARLRELRLPGIAAAYRDIGRLAEKDGLAYEAYLLALLDQERQERTNRKIERLRKEAKLPPDKTLEHFDLKRVPTLPKALVRTLCEGDFLDRAENVLVFGTPGTGKTHLVCGLAHELVRKGRAVLFTPAYALVQTLVRAKRDLRLEAVLRRLDRFEAVLIDDIGYVRQERGEMEVLFTFLSQRYERRSVVITSNLVFSKWEEIFHDAMMTAAAIDRLVHHARIIELPVTSYRAEQAHRRIERRRPSGQDTAPEGENEKPDAKEQQA